MQTVSKSMNAIVLLSAAAPAFARTPDGVDSKICTIDPPICKAAK